MVGGIKLTSQVLCDPLHAFWKAAGFSDFYGVQKQNVHVFKLFSYENVQKLQRY